MTVSAVAAAMAVVAIGCAFSPAQAARPIPGEWAIVLTALVATDTVCATIAFTLAHVLHRPAVVALGLAFVAQCVFSLATVAAAPGILSPAGNFGGPDAAAWLFVLSQLSFGAGCAVYLLDGGDGGNGDGGGWRMATSRPVLWTFGLGVLGLSVLTIALVHAHVLPPLTSPSAGGLVALLATAIVALYLCAIALAIRRGAWLGGLGAWVFVALFGHLCEIVLAALIRMPGSYAWYGSHVEALIAAAAIFASMLGEMMASARHFNALAMHDPLTGLANPRGLRHFVDVVGRGRRSSRAVLMIDIDSFKAFNDAYGHPTGDAALRSVADVVRGSIRDERDCAVRMGGDEFLVVLTALAKDEAERIAERIRETVTHLKLRGARTSLSVSIGLAFDPDGSLDAHAMIGASDAALYEAKGKGRNCVRAARAI